MTLKSALEDLRETTLAAISGGLAKLAYLGSLRKREGGYHHWGLTLIHGEESSDRALKAAHTEVLSSVLRAPISELEQELQVSTAIEGKPAEAYVEGLKEQFTELLPTLEDELATQHLNSVLIALSALEKSRKGATQSTS
jgi:hypothetical protein